MSRIFTTLFKRFKVVDFFSVLGLTGIAFIHLGPESGIPFRDGFQIWNVLLDASLLFYLFEISICIRLISNIINQTKNFILLFLKFIFCYLILLILDFVIGNKFIHKYPLHFMDLFNQFIFKSNVVFTNDYVIRNILLITIILFVIIFGKKDRKSTRLNSSHT